MKATLAVLGTLVLVMVVMSFTSFGLYSILKPLGIGVDYRAFHESQPYNDGMARDLENFQIEYANATDQNKKDTIRAVVLNRFAGYDASRLPGNLQMFLNALKTGN